MSVDQLYQRLAAGVSLEGEDGAIRVRATYEPGSGPGTKVSPPTYPPKSRGDSAYVIEPRVMPDGSQLPCALLDSRQSQANRCEEALQEAIDDRRLQLPYLVLDIETHQTPFRITSLTAPHRSRDAYFRDSVDTEGRRFDETPVGSALKVGGSGAFYRQTPADLVYGVWDSHRQRRIQIKFPRVYTSELMGEGAIEGDRRAGRFDLLTGGKDIRVKDGALDWSLAEKGDKGTEKISEIGLGPIPPNPVTGGGVTVRTIRRDATLSFAGLSRLRVADETALARHGRTVLAALALLGDRLAFGRPGVFLRSGCDLVLTDETLAWVSRKGEEPFELVIGEAFELFSLAVDRAAAAGLTWDVEPIRLLPSRKLQEVIDRVFLTSPEEGD